MAKQTQSEKHQKAIETIVGSFKLNINTCGTRDSGLFSTGFFRHGNRGNILLRLLERKQHCNIYKEGEKGMHKILKLKVKL